MSKDKQIKLSEKEKKRVEKTNATAAELEAAGYRKSELTITIKKAMLITIGIWLVYSMLSGMLFSLRNTSENIKTLVEYIILAGLLVLSIAVHELLHGITWRFLVKDKKSIEFGFTPERMTPYCTCSEPLSRGKYILGGIMPFLVLGVLMTIIAIFTGSRLLLSFSNLNVFGAGGDLIVITKLLLYKSKAKEMLILDHPTEAGCLIFEK